ncbi:MAG: hypothetical protein O7E52_13975 [Candidatus Poribacteria bacterium]|nr:hypothetical protein [Candidatus Poribacteria bacterium]
MKHTLLSITLFTLICMFFVASFVMSAVAFVQYFNLQMSKITGGIFDGQGVSAFFNLFCGGG